MEVIPHALIASAPEVYEGELYEKHFLVSKNEFLPFSFWRVHSVTRQWHPTENFLFSDSKLAASAWNEETGDHIESCDLLNALLFLSEVAEESQ